MPRPLCMPGQQRRPVVRAGACSTRPQAPDRGRRRAAGRFWSVEVALPLAGLALNTSAALPPRPGDLWRINFSRARPRARRTAAAARGRLLPVPFGLLPRTPSRRRL